MRSEMRAAPRQSPPIESFPVSSMSEQVEPRTLDARSRVHRHIAKQVRRFPDLLITGVDTRGLDSRDAAFARALDQTVIRRWLTLQRIASSQLTRPWETLEDPVKAALLLGTAQILFMDHVPNHAAINETVQRVRNETHNAASGLVNAVLRAVSRLLKGVLDAGDPAPAQCLQRRDLVPLADGRALILDGDVFSDDEVQRLVEQTSHGKDLVLHWIGAHGFERTRQLCLHDLVIPPITITASNPDSIQGESLTPHRKPGFYTWRGAPGELGTFLKNHPEARVQDPGNAEPVAMTAGLAANLIVDYCAGRGTKTKQLAEVHPEARIIASDIEPFRQASLAETFSEHSQVEVVEHGDFAEAIGRTNLLLLDVPCTNTGVLPRRPEAKYRFSKESLASLARIQRAIVRETEPLLAPSGAVVFATCSLEPAENERQVAELARKHGLSVQSSIQRFPEGLPGDDPSLIHDGSFHAILTR